MGISPKAFGIALSLERNPCSFRVSSVAHFQMFSARITTLEVANGQAAP